MTGQVHILLEQRSLVRLHIVIIDNHSKDKVNILLEQRRLVRTRVGKCLKEQPAADTLFEQQSLVKLLTRS